MNTGHDANSSTSAVHPRHHTTWRWTPSIIVQLVGMAVMVLTITVSIAKATGQSQHDMDSVRVTIADHERRIRELSYLREQLAVLTANQQQLTKAIDAVSGDIRFLRDNITTKKPKE